MDIQCKASTVDEVEARKQARSLKHESPDVLLVTELFPPAIGGSPALFEGVYSRLEGLQVVVLTDEVTSAPALGCTQEGLDIMHGPIRTRRWGILDVRALAHHLSIARRVYSLTRGGQTVVHCGRALPEGVAALLCRLLVGTPFIVWTHGEDITSALTSRELTFLMKQVYRGATAILANSLNTRRMLNEIGVSEGKIRVVYPGVDAERFHPAIDGSCLRHRFVSSPEDILLLSIGRHQRRKGHDHAIEAMAALRSELPNLRYVIAGDGDERQRLETMVAERRLGNHVIFVGEVAAADLPAYYAACDIFLHPNRIDDGDVEGFGIVFLEAAASGKPAIGGRSGGVPEAVDDGVTGLLVSGTDVQELAAAIRQLAGSPGLRARLGSAGRCRVLRSFTWQAAAQAVGALHTDVAACFS